MPTVRACPDCETADVVARTPGTLRSHGRDRDGGRYRCNACDWTGDEVLERETPRAGRARRGLAKQLADGTPEDFGLTPTGERPSRGDA